MQAFIYFASLIILLCLFFIYISPKIEGLLNILMIIFTSYLSYIAIVSILLDTLKIKTTGMSVSLVNILVIIFMIYVMKKNDGFKILKPKLSFLDVFALIISAGFAIYTFFNMYSSSLNINFLTTDPSVHYLFANYFSHTGRLLLSVNEMIPYEHMSSYPFLSYVNTGLIMSFIQSNHLKLAIYLISNVVLYFFTLIIIYNIFKKLVKSTDYIQVLILIVAAAIGYNMNSVIFGFTSQIAGILLALSFIFLADSLRKSTFRTILLTLNIIGVFYAYYYFIPSAVAGFVIAKLINHKYKQNDIKLSFRTISKVLFDLENVIVCGAVMVFGGIYLVLLNHTVEAGNVSSIAAEGFIYRELYSDFKPYLLFAGISLFYMIKGKGQNSTLPINTLMYIFFACGVFILGMMGKASSYYFYKNYYMLENLLIILFVIGLNYTKDKFKPLFISYVCIIVLLGLSTFVFDTPIQKKNNLFNIEIERNLTKVQKFNIEIPENMTPVYTKEQIEFMDYIIKNKDVFVASNSYLPVLGDILQQLWFYSYTEIWPKYNSNALSSIYEPKLLDYNSWRLDSNKNPYIVIIDKTSDQWVEEEGFDRSLFDIIYKAEGITLLKYKD